MKLVGTLEAAAGIVEDSHLRVWYEPDTDVYGFDEFTYVISHCPFMLERQSEPGTITLNIDGTSNQPAIAVTAMNVSSKFRLLCVLC